MFPKNESWLRPDDILTLEDIIHLMIL